MINIADRLHSTATEQTVAGANEIYDDAKGKKQNVINQENDEHFSNLEDESVRVVPQEFTQTEQAQARQNLNTYSKNEVNQIASAFTEQNYVSVQAVAATTAADIATLINATGEGERTDTIYRVGWFDGTAFDVTKYSEYTWNGTAYVQMDVRSSIGEVFDISVYNQSGGTPVQYETLALALGTDGANVPSGVRQGGMSVKYIQSSDNNYVQFRYLPDDVNTAAKFTNINNWSVYEDIVFVENPEFAYVFSDKKKRIAIAVEKDGNVMFGAGVPRQVIEYVEAKVAELDGDVDAIRDFLSGFSTYTTLKEYLEDTYGVYTENPEWALVILDSQRRIAAGIKKDGSVEWFVGVPTAIREYIDGRINEIMSGSETTDIDGVTKIINFLSGLSTDTTLKAILDDIEERTPELVENPEFSEVVIDLSKRIISYRDKDGVKHENVGFESPYIKTNNLDLSEEGLEKLSKGLPIKPINRLPCLPKEIVDATEDDYVFNRCQNCLVAHKSFKPLLDFKGRLAHKIVIQGSGRNYWQYNLSSEILFEERFTLRLDTGNYGNTRIYTKHSDNLKDWVTESVSSIFGTYAFINSESDSCYGNDNSLLITNERVQYYDGEDLKSAILPLWSLDGGLHFEPLINNFRGHFSVANNILSEGTVVTIGQKTYTCISSSDANTAMEALVGDNTEELITAGLEYLADKIVLSTNSQDSLRMLAWHLVEEGYFVRLEDEELIVYSKIVGTAGNIQSDISIGNTTYSFIDGQDYSTTPQLVNAAQILPSTLPITHSDGSPITSSQAWTYMSWLFINGVWYMAADMSSTTMTTNIVVKITDITDAINTSTYKVLMSQPLNYNTEPLLTYDKVHNIIFIGLRDDKSTKTGVIKYFYSTDGGDNYTMFTIENPFDNLSWKYNTKIFLAEPPNIFNGSSTNEGYEYPNSTYNLIYVSIVYCRASGIAWVATADIPTTFDKNVSKLEWSEYKPLNHFIPKDEKDWKPVLGDFPDYRLRSFNAGMGSVGAMVYSRLYKGIVIGYQGMKVVGKQPSYCMGVAIEHC